MSESETETEKSHVGLRIPTALKEEWQADAEAEDRALSRYVRHAVEWYRTNTEPRETEASPDSDGENDSENSLSAEALARLMDKLDRLEEMTSGIDDRISSIEESGIARTHPAGDVPDTDTVLYNMLPEGPDPSEYDPESDVPIDDRTGTDAPLEEVGIHARELSRRTGLSREVVVDRLEYLDSQIRDVETHTEQPDTVWAFKRGGG